MHNTEIFNASKKMNAHEKSDVVDFLFENLEQYGDPKAHIEKCINYALEEIPSFGGFVIVSSEAGKITGAVVINQTGMGGYIPENILVYIATHKDMRGQGLGKQLMNESIDMAKGDIALHVEANNPARFLYEKKGFKNLYLEMRLKKG